MVRRCKCRQCGVEFTGGPRAFFCSSCRHERQLEQDRKYKQRKRMGTVRKVGSQSYCATCGKPYTVKGGNQAYCPDCAPVVVKQKARELSLQWYRNNKDEINPVRKVRRRQGMKICLVCGKEFDPQGTCRKCCSPECRRIRKNERWRINKKKKMDE